MNYKSFAALLQYKFWNTWALMSGLLLSQTAVVSFWMFIFSLFSITYVFKGICISRPRPSAWPRPPALATNLYLPALASNLCLPARAPNLYLPALAPNFYLPALAGAWACIYQPCPPNLYLLALAYDFLLLCSDFAFLPSYL